MAEEQVISLLTEIRDLQKQHLRNYKEAIANQHQSLEIQKQGWGGRLDVSPAVDPGISKTNRSVRAISRRYVLIKVSDNSFQPVRAEATWISSSVMNNFS